MYIPITAYLISSSIGSFLGIKYKSIDNAYFYTVLFILLFNCTIFLLLLNLYNKISLFKYITRDNFLLLTTINLLFLYIFKRLFIGKIVSKLKEKY